MALTPPKEGRINLMSAVDGLFSVNKKKLYALNSVEHVAFTTVPDRYPVKAGEMVAATRILPLYIDDTTLKKAERIGKQGVIKILPFKSMRGGLVVTGSEVFSGRIKDGSPIVEERLKKLWIGTYRKRVCPDDVGSIRDAIKASLRRALSSLLRQADFPWTPMTSRRKVLQQQGPAYKLYGAPVFPGAMFLVARRKGKYILGVPACVYYSRNTILDIILPWVLAGVSITKSDILKLGHGGLCMELQGLPLPELFLRKGQIV